MKTCCACKTLKDESEFGKNRSRSDGLQSSCRSCVRAYNTGIGEDGLIRWQRNNAKLGEDGLTTPQRYYAKIGDDGLTNQQRETANRSGKRRAKHLTATYGMTLENFERALSEQGGVCAICKVADKKWHVDHDHKTGKVRAILCFNCNTGIGLLGDSARIATAAAEYLTKHGSP